MAFWSTIGSGISDFVSGGLDFIEKNPEVAAQLGGGFLGLLGASFMGAGTKDVAEATNAARAALAEMTNEQQKELLEITRGAGGNAILPMYFPEAEDGTTFEEELARDAVNQYRSTRDNLDDSLALGDEIWQDFAKRGGAFDLGNQFIEDVLSGDKLEDRQALLDSVYGQIMDGVNERLDGTEASIEDRQALADDLYNSLISDIDSRTDGLVDAAKGIQSIAGDVYSKGVEGVDSRIADAISNLDQRLAEGYGFIDDAEERSYDILGRQEELNQDASKARRSAINTGLGDRLAQIQMARQRKGLGGSSSFSDALLAGSTIGARQQAAMGDINDQRALLGEEARINENYLNPRLGLNETGVRHSSGFNQQGINAFQGLTQDYGRNMTLGQQAIMDAKGAGINAATRAGEGRTNSLIRGADQLTDLNNRRTTIFGDLATAYGNDSIRGHDANTSYQGSMLDAPYTRTAQAYEFGQMPEKAASNTMSRARNDLGWFNIGTANPYQIQTPEYSSVPNSWQAIGAGLLQGGKALGNWDWEE